MGTAIKGLGSWPLGWYFWLLLGLSSPGLDTLQATQATAASAASQSKPGKGGGGGTPTPVANELTFTFNSAANPWTAPELAILQQALQDIYPVAKAVYGQPAFPLAVNVRKTGDLTYSGEYNASLSEIVLLNSFRVDVLCHEMLHAFRDRNMIAFSSFEEGMVRAAEIEVFNRLPGYDYPMGKHHSYEYDVYYEGLNRPSIGAQNGNFFAGYLSPLLRYQLAGYAWGKALLENPGFLITFNQRYSAQLASDPALGSSESKLIALIAALQPTVEGKQFSRWYAQQWVLNMNPPKGLLLYDRINQYTLDFFYRDQSGRETMLAGQSILSSMNNFQDIVLDTAITETSANGFVSYWPRIPENYIGRAKISATARFMDVSTLVESIATDVSFDAVGCDTGVFGVVPEQDAGLVRMTPLDAAMLPSDVRLVNGAFSAPELTGVKGRFVATLTDLLGRDISRQFTKDASDYFLPLSSTAALADLMVSQVYTKRIAKSGTTVTLSLTVKNLSGQTATDILLIDWLPGGATLSNVTVSAGTYSTSSVPINGILTINLDNLNVGASVTALITLTYATTPPASVANIISLKASSLDPNPSNNASTVVFTVGK